jgi:hypothetical protein
MIMAGQAPHPHPVLMRLVWLPLVVLSSTLEAVVAWPLFLGLKLCAGARPVFQRRS